MTCLGVSSLGKASYVITLTPYFVLTALLAYAAPREVLEYDGEGVAILIIFPSRREPLME